MAESPAHRFGQIIGDTLERAIRPILEAVAKELGLYLDGKGERKARGTKRKVAWVDGKGNTHDLDYVFEAGGTPETIGSPRAFIEIAWSGSATVTATRFAGSSRISKRLSCSCAPLSRIDLERSGTPTKVDLELFARKHPAF